jgi:hypothetical protein
MYRVNLTGVAEETWQVEADSRAEAASKWAEGKLLVSENSSMEVECVHGGEPDE